tara:strand:- start:911 stop:1144 length:234 start_codon:yes stop_codon:yes gene_type:complete
MKKYMAYSFGTLWTLVLIVALVATIIHQAKFQDSATELNLNHQISALEQQKQELEGALKQTKHEYAMYRERVTEGFW